MRARLTNVTIEPIDDDKNDEVVTGKVISVGELVPKDLTKGLVVWFNKFAGQRIKEFIILNHEEIIAIDE